MKASHRPTARILTGLARSKSYENSVIPADTITDLVNTYCLHLTNRVADDEQERGKEHIRETYMNLVIDQLYENPSPTAESYYCSKDALQTRLQAELDTAQTVAERADTITNFDAWKQTIEETDATDDELQKKWRRDLVRWVEDIARAKHAGRTYVTELRSGEYTIDHAGGETTAFDALHDWLHEARSVVDNLPADVAAEIVEQLDDEYSIGIASD